VLLQAEPETSPGADEVSDLPPADQAEKLELAAELMQDGVPAVLLLPVLPGRIADDIARAVAEHAALRHGFDAQVLLRWLRAIIAPHVPPPVLDDIALFLNEGRYRD
jgi:hypothetical protein